MSDRQAGADGEPPGGAGGAQAAPSGALTALTQAPLGIAIFDRDMRYVAASRRYLTDQGLPGDTPIIGRLHYEVFPEVPQKWRDLHLQALTHGVELSHEADPYVRADGAMEWIRWSVAPWRDADGRIGGLILYTEIVTPQVQSRQSIEAAEARYRAVFDHAPMGIARVSPEGEFLEINDRFCQIVQRSREDVRRLTFQDITHPDDLEADLSQVRRVLAGDLESYAIEKRYLAPSGETVWIELTVALVRNPDGSPAYFISIIEDIGVRVRAQAEQRRYQSQQRLMINELNHRVKNTLATVQSMAAQTLRSDADSAQAYGKFEARLLGLAEVHDVLTRESWHGAALEDIAERAMRPFGGASGQISVSGPQVWLAPGAALTLALILHELATNAVKYGALGAAAGRVSLRWTYDPADGQLSITWSEQGGPVVRPPTRRGFGSRLIERGWRNELGGEARLFYEPSGLVCEMRAKIAERAEALDLPPLEPGEPSG